MLTRISLPLLLVAFHLTASPQQSPEPAPTTTIAIGEAPDPTVTLTAVQAIAEPHRFEPTSYTLRNGGTKPITAVLVNFQLESEDGSGVIGQSHDFLMGNSDLAPGETRTFDARGTVVNNGTSRIAKVTARITFLEFADGSAAGDNSPSIIDNLEKSRNRTRTCHRTFAEAFDRSPAADEATRLDHALSAVSSMSGPCSFDPDLIRKQARTVGVSKAVAQFRQPRQLPGRQ